MLPAVEAAVAAGILIDHRVEKSVPGGSGTQSSFLPAPHLADIKLPKKIPTDHGELIRLKDKAGELASYKDSKRSDRDRVLMRKINGIIAKATIELRAGVVDGDVIRFPKHCVYPDMISLCRVYSGGWMLGGRMYAGYWQQVPSKDRQHFFINGNSTVEIDYAQLHPLMLYMMVAPDLVGETYSANGKVGMQIRGVGDAYDIAGYDRKLCKVAFNVLINAESFPSAFLKLCEDMDETAIAQRAAGIKRPKPMKGKFTVYPEKTRTAVKAIIDAMKRKHHRVAHLFHSGLGLKFQFVDSQMSTMIMNDLCIKKDICVLPIHDSYIVESQHVDTLIAAMKKALETVPSTVLNTVVETERYGKRHPHTLGCYLGVSGGCPAPPAPLDSDSESPRESDSESVLTTPDRVPLPVARTRPSSARRGVSRVRAIPRLYGATLAIEDTVSYALLDTF